MEAEIIFGGSGGQGILLMAELLGRTISRKNLEVLYYTSYGGEIRGGASDCFVTVSKEPVGSPIISEASILLGMSFPGLQRYINQVAPGGLIMVNASQVPEPDPVNGARVVPVQADEIAAELGNMRAANFIALGALIGVTKMVTLDELITLLGETLPAHRHDMIEVNKQALQKGMDAVSGEKVWKMPV